MTKFPVADYLRTAIDCDCGRTHTVDINTVEISANALEKVAAIVLNNGYSKPFVISDYNTHQVAGEELLDLLEKEEIVTSFYRFEDEALVADEDALGRLFVNFDPECDLIIAVGAGTINDISRFFSHRLNIPYYVVATAPSMDGYASTVAPLIKNNLKTTFECHMPKAIIADLDVLAEAPREMIAAGFGDVIGKYTCLADWTLSSIINDEYYCETVVQLTQQSLERTVEVRDGIAKGDKKAIGELMEALVLAGIGMSYVGNSRPASGSEHHLSHFWEMRFLLEGKPAILHGIKVGIGAVVIARLYERLRKENLEPASIRKIKPPVDLNWAEKISDVFLSASSEVVELERVEGKNEPDGHQKRIQAIADNWKEITKVLHSVPKAKVIVELIESVNGPSSPSDVEINSELVQQAILYAKEIRPRYTILQLLWDLDRLEGYAITNF